MNLYLDDNSAKGVLVVLLQKAGHHVVVPKNAGMVGASDVRHFTYAKQHDLVVLTRDHDDFEDLHLLVQLTGGQHSGLLAVCSDNDPSRDMKDRDIVRAIGNLVRAGVPLFNEFLVLNHWQ